MKHSLGTIAALIILLINTLAMADPQKIEEKPASTDTGKKAYLQVQPTDIVLGDLKAPVTMIEYASLSCPHCAYFHKDVLPQLKTSFIDTGKMKFIHRGFSLDEPSLRGETLAYCAGAERFYTFIKVLFEKQASWAYEKNYLEILGNIGKLGGVSGEAFDKCLKDKTIENTLLESKLAAANILGVSATPTFFINGEKHNGANSVDYFTNALNKALATPAIAGQPTNTVNNPQ